MTQGELDRRIGTLESIAAEGSILARQVAEERTKTTFARVRARELADDVDHESEKIADATPEADQVGRRDRTVELADRVGAALGELQTFPDEPGRAAGIESDLERLAGRLSDLLARK